MCLVFLNFSRFFFPHGQNWPQPVSLCTGRRGYGRSWRGQVGPSVPLSRTPYSLLGRRRPRMPSMSAIQFLRDIVTNGQGSAPFSAVAQERYHSLIGSHNEALFHCPQTPGIAACGLHSLKYRDSILHCTCQPRDSRYIHRAAKSS